MRRTVNVAISRAARLASTSYVKRLYNSFKSENSTSHNVSPAVNIVFKKLFGVKEHEDILLSFINSIMGVDDQLIGLTLLNPYDAKNVKSENLSILDVKAAGAGGQTFKIEVQLAEFNDFGKAAIDSWAKLYTEQLFQYDNYSKLCKVIVIHILNFNFVQISPKYHNVFRIRGKSTGAKYFDDFELHTIELRKFRGDATEGLHEIVARTNSTLDMWTTFLSRNDLLKADTLPEKINNPYLKKAINVLDVMKFTPEERVVYEDHVKYLRMEHITLQKAIEDSSIENEIKMVMKMLKNNCSTEKILKVSDLSREEIENLRKGISE